MYLISYNFVKSIYHGKKLLDFKSASPQSRYNVHMYLAEANCMIGKFKESYEQLDEADMISNEDNFSHNENENSQIYNVLHQVEHKFRQINVISKSKSTSNPKD